MVDLINDYHARTEGVDDLQRLSGAMLGLPDERCHQAAGIENQRGPAGFISKCLDVQVANASVEFAHHCRI